MKQNLNKNRYFGILLGLIVVIFLGFFLLSQWSKNHFAVKKKIPNIQKIDFQAEFDRLLEIEDSLADIFSFEENWLNKAQSDSKLLSNIEKINRSFSAENIALKSFEDRNEILEKYNSILIDIIPGYSYKYQRNLVYFEEKYKDDPGMMYFVQDMAMIQAGFESGLFISFDDVMDDFPLLTPALVDTIEGMKVIFFEKNFKFISAHQLRAYYPEYSYTTFSLSHFSKSSSFLFLDEEEKLGYAEAMLLHEFGHYSQDTKFFSKLLFTEKFNQRTIVVDFMDKLELLNNSSLQELSEMWARACELSEPQMGSLLVCISNFIYFKATFGAFIDEDKQYKRINLICYNLLDQAVKRKKLESYLKSLTIEFGLNGLIASKETNKKFRDFLEKLGGTDDLGRFLQKGITKIYLEETLKRSPSEIKYLLLK